MPELIYHQGHGLAVNAHSKTGLAQEHAKCVGNHFQKIETDDNKQ